MPAKGRKLNTSRPLFSPCFPVCFIYADKACFVCSDVPEHLGKKCLRALPPYSGCYCFQRVFPSPACCIPDMSAIALKIMSLPATAKARLRSEEHTSELQSLMRISYAVFCLKKKKHK